jgi:hypothetical protein
MICAVFFIAFVYLCFIENKKNALKFFEEILLKKQNEIRLYG